MKPKEKFFICKVITCLLGAGFGAFIIICGLTGDFFSGGDYVSSSSFGGDFYTYEYRATRAAANNVESVGFAVNEIGAMLLIAIGGVTFLAFMFLFFVVLSKHSKFMSDMGYGAPAYPKTQPNVYGAPVNNFGAPAAPIAPAVPEAPQVNSVQAPGNDVPPLNF